MLRPGKERIVEEGAGGRRATARICATFSLIFLSKDSFWPVIRNMKNWTLSHDGADSAVVQTDSDRTNVPLSGQTDLQEHSVTDTEDWGTTVASPHGLKGLSPASLPVPLSSCGTTSSTMISASFTRKKSQKLTAAERREDRRLTKAIKISHPKTKKMEDYPMRSLESVTFASASILKIKYLTHISSVQHRVCQ